MNSIHFTIQKVSSVLETIRSIKEMDFPYDDPLDAIKLIQSIFEEHLTHLKHIESPKAARSICKQIHEDIDNFLLAIGFMVRSCDVSGAFELQGPMLRMTHDVIGQHVRLVISSEWGFSPFTLLYPGEFGNKFVLVGLPISEASNPLIAPLAGHELGHNVWRRLPKLQAYVGEHVKTKAGEVIRGKLWSDFSRMFGLKQQDELDQDDLFGNIASWQIAIPWAISQCEEMFCDFFGIALFGVSYLHAFEYLLAPGGGFRSPSYPSMRERVESLVKAATRMGIAPPANYLDAFDDSDTSSDPKQQLLLSISDHASLSLVPDLIDAAFQLVTNTSMEISAPSDVENAFSHLKRAVPATGIRNVASIVNAAWQLFLDPVNYWESAYPVTKEEPERRHDLIKELTLKSFEVFEIEKLLERKLE